MKKLNVLLSMSVLLSIGALTSCMDNAYHKRQVQNTSQDRITVGKVQREIKKGMNSGDVVAIFGSPNIVSTGEGNTEVWIYDKVSTTVSHSNSSGGLIIGGLVSGIIGGGDFSSNSGATNSSQRTLTIIIKFDTNNKVRDFSYRTSSF